MKKLITLVILALIDLLITVPYSMVQSHSAEPPTGNTGAPGETTCQSCHSSFALNSGVGKVTISIDTSNSYKADSTYTITVVVKDSTEKRFGFELTALNSSNDAAGKISLTNTSNTDLQSANSRSYVAQKNANTTNTWTFNWTAPSLNNGNITLYACGVAANDNGGSDGDEVYTTNLNVKFDTVILTSIQQPITNNRELAIYPVPASNFLNLSLPISISSPITINLYDITGKQLYKWNFGTQPVGQFNCLLYLKDLSLHNGLYLINVVSDGSSRSQKILIQNTTP